MPWITALARPRTLLAGYVVFRVGLAAALIALFGVEAMLNMLWSPEWMALVVGVPTLAGVVGLSFGLDGSRR